MHINYKNIFFFLFSFWLIILNIIRIINIPITYDETGTASIINQSYYTITHFIPPNASNHILNSIVCKFFAELFNNDLIFLRFGSLFAQIIYLLFTYLIAIKLFPKFIWQAFIMVILNTNPLIFQFWGLCRGYGLANGFMAGGIYFMLSYFQHKTPKYLIATLILSILSTISNYSYLNFYIALSCVLLIGNFFSNRKKYIIKELITEIIIIIVFTTLLYLLIVQDISDLRKNNEFYYGGENGFFKDTIKSLVHYSFYLNPASNISKIIIWIVTISSIAPAIFWLVYYFKHRNNDTFRIGVLLWLMIFIPFLLVEIQFLFLHTKFLTDRTAQLFIPLYFLQLIFMINIININKIKNLIMSFLILILCVNFYFDIDFYSSSMWWADAYTYAVIDKINKHFTPKKSKATLRVNWLSGPSISYHAQKKYPDKIDVVYDRNIPKNDTSNDYYYIMYEDKELISPSYEVDTSFKDGKFILMRKKSI